MVSCVMSALLQACCTCLVLHLFYHAVVYGDFLPSQVECLDGAEDSAKLCILSNVVVWNGSVYLVHDSSAEAATLPRLRLAGWGPADSFNVSDYFKSAALDAAPFISVQNVTRHAYAVLHHASLPSNHAHNFIETLPALFERLCRFLGACEYTDRRLRSSEGLLLLWLQRHPRASVLPSLLEAVACMSSRQMALEGASCNEVIMVQEFLVGIPSAAACHAQPLCERYNSYNETDIVPRRLRFMRQCAGLPPQPPLRRDNPRVLFINRRHNAGRSVLAMAEAYNYLKVNGAEHEHVVAKLTYMEGLSLAQQAKLIDSADILVIPHGSTFGNVIFAARKSVIVHISSSEGHRSWNEQFSHAFDAVLNITSISVEPPPIGGLDMISAKVHPAIRHWTQQQLLDLIAKGLCPDGEAWCSDQNLFSQNYNYALAYETLVEKVIEAMHVWRGQRSAVHLSPVLSSQDRTEHI